MDRKRRVLMPDDDDPPPPPITTMEMGYTVSRNERLNALERVLKHSVSSMLSPEFPRIADAVNELVFHPPFTLPEERKGLPLGDVFDEMGHGERKDDEIGDRFQDISIAYDSFLRTISDLIPTNYGNEFYTETRILESVAGTIVTKHKREYFCGVRTVDDFSQPTFPHALWLIRDEPGEVAMIAIHATVIMDGEGAIADEIVIYGMRGLWVELSMKMDNRNPFVVGGSPFMYGNGRERRPGKGANLTTKGMWSQHGFPSPSVFVANYYASSIFKLKELLRKI